MALISTIVPVYKVEPYIEKCIDSILSQSFNDFELILIDDGSPDACSAICDEYSSTDERIIVIHQKNGGQSVARNMGMKLMNSDYVTFVDSDDYISRSYLMTLHRAFTDLEVDVSICNHIAGNQNNYEFKNCSNTNETIITGYLWCIIHYLKGPFKAFPWGKMFRTSLFAGRSFTEGMVYEDEELIPIIMNEAKRVYYVDQPEYYYFQSTDSTVRSKMNQYKYDCLMEAQNKCISYFKEHSYDNIERYANMHKDFDRITNSIGDEHNELINMMDTEDIEKKLISLFPTRYFIAEIQDILTLEVKSIYDSNSYLKYYFGILLRVNHFCEGKNKVLRKLIRKLLHGQRDDSRWTIKAMTSTYASIYPCRTWIYRKLRNMNEFVCKK